ncbi:hypothetical protein [Streptomyces sp. NPDC001340]
MTTLPSALQAPASAPETLGRCRELVRPALTKFGLNAEAVR